MSKGGDNAGDRLAPKLFPEPPDQIRSDLMRLQFDRLKGQIPFLHGTGAFSMILIIWLAVHDRAPWGTIALLSALPLFSIFRIVTWERQTSSGLSDDHLAQFIKRTTIIGSAAVSLSSGLAVYCYLTEVSSEPIVIPLSLFFGIICISFSFAPLPRAAILALGLGIVPPAIALIMFGDLLARMVAVSGLSVGLLLVRFVHEYFREIVASLLLEQQVREQATTDPLTGLVNRRGFDALLEAALAHAAETRQSVTLGFADLDNFKLINDRFGHGAGDEYLRTAARRLLDAVPTDTVVARLGGDEFGLILSPTFADSEVDGLGQAILQNVCHDVILAGATHRISLSLGLASGRDSADTLMRHADEALYEAKNAGKNRYFRYGQRLPDIGRQAAE